MELGIRIDLPAKTIENFCQKWDVSELSLFGSVLRPSFRADSDIDVLVTFASGATHGLFDFVQMQDELADILDHKVDLVSRRGVEASRNPFRRKVILESARVIYASAR